MVRTAGSRCLFCSLCVAQREPAQWLSRQTRFMSSKIKKPTRMTLQTSITIASSTKNNQSVTAGPFGGMNQKSANIRGIPERQPEFALRRTNENPHITGRNKDRLAKKGKGKGKGFKALKMQSALAPVSYEQRTKIKRQLDEVECFTKFDLLPAVVNSIHAQSLHGMVYVRPTPIQKLAIPALLGDRETQSKRVKAEREEFLIAAETGSGKTLSYLIPVINAIKLAEAKDVEALKFEKQRHELQTRKNNELLFSPPMTEIPHPTTGRPRAIILVPTQELVTQVGRLVKSFGHTVKYRSAMISSAFTGTVIRNRLFSPRGIDILISTPHLLKSIAESEPNILSRVTHLIIDEADSLLDRGFIPLTSAIIDRATPSLKKLILCSATIPRSLDKYLRVRFPYIKRLVTPNLHAIPRRVQLRVVDIEQPPYQGNKNLACADTIWSIGNIAAENYGPLKRVIDIKRIIVFVNERESTVEIKDYLISKGVNAIALNRDTPDERESEILASFTQSGPLFAPKLSDRSGSLPDFAPHYVPIGKELPPVKRSLPHVQVVVTTDLGARGIDTVAVRNVILYDVPHSTIDFIHRLGRTGRMGRRGKGYVLVGKHDRRDIVAEVREGMYSGKALI